MEQMSEDHRCVGWKQAAKATCSRLWKGVCATGQYLWREGRRPLSFVLLMESNLAAWSYSTSYVAVPVLVGSLVGVWAYLGSKRAQDRYLSRDEMPVTSGIILGGAAFAFTLVVSGADYGHDYLARGERLVRHDGAAEKQIVEELDSSDWRFDPATKDWTTSVPLTAKKGGKTYTATIADVRNEILGNRSATESATKHYAIAKITMPVTVEGFFRNTTETRTVEIESTKRPGAYKLPNASGENSTLTPK
jgi:hypothetical protein